jgi:hypothetical protein
MTETKSVPKLRLKPPKLTEEQEELLRLQEIIQEIANFENLESDELGLSKRK